MTNKWMPASDGVRAGGRRTLPYNPAPIRRPGISTTQQTTTRISGYVAGSRRRAASFWGAVASQPSWVIRVALTAFLVVIALPLAVLFIVGLVAATLVFGLLAGVNRLMAVLRGEHRDGRENVRVRRRSG